MMINQEEFNRYLSQALANLFDFVQLEHNPLGDFLPAEELADSGSRGRALQQAIIRSIAALKPSNSISPLALQWRTFNLLRMRYIEGHLIKEVMNSLQVGDRQLRRENQRAIAALASILWDEWHIPFEETPVIETQEAHPRRFSTKPSPVSLFETFESILATLNSMVGATRQNIRLDLPLDTSLVQSDRVLLRQVFITTFHSYLSHHPEDQVNVTGRLAEKTLELIVQGAHHQLTLAKEEYENLKELFLQVNNVLHFEAGRVVLELPVAEARKILVIDDDESTIHLFRRYLTGLPYIVIAAQDSKRAVQLAEQARPDLILLDVLLPNVDGWEVLQQLKHNEIVHETPVIICSAWNEPEIAYSLGANGFLHKHVLQQDLIDAIDQVLGAGIEAD